MIRTDAEYREAKKQLVAERRRLAEHERRLLSTPLEEAELKRALDPLRSFQFQLAEEVAEYERLKAGETHRLLNLRELGRALVATRISRSMTQRELAERLGVHESQVSRDEKNEYRGLTVDRASRILDALGVDLVISFDVRRTPPKARRKRAADALNHQIEAYYSAQSPEEQAEDKAWGELGTEDWSAADEAQPVMRETSGPRHRKRASRAPARIAKR